MGFCVITRPGGGSNGPCSEACFPAEPGDPARDLGIMEGWAVRAFP